MATTQKIDDYGEKIGGARKDLWREALGRGELESIDRADWAQAVNKANIWPAPDWKALVEAGSDPVGTYLVKLVYDGIPKAPPSNLRIEQEERFMRAYVDMVSCLRSLIERRLPVASADESMREIRDTARKNLSQDAYAIAPARLRNALFYHRRYAAERHIQDTDWPHQKPWVKAFRVVPSNNEFLVVRPGGRIVAGPFPSHAEATTAADTLWTQARDAAAKERTGLARPVAKGTPRTGPDRRNGANVGAEDFARAFGFRAVEFGNWESQDDRQGNLNAAFDAFHDLAEAIGIAPRDLSLGGTLAIAFGSRGRGGAAAHYEPGRKVINLTRDSGAGCLAHEWAHALDNHLAADVGGGSAAYASEMRGTGTRLEAMHKAMHVMQRTFEPAADIEIRHRKNVAEVEAVRRASKSPWEQNRCWKWLARAEGQMTAIRNAGGAWTESKFLAAAKEKGAYWRRSNEMFARAFEAHVEDALTTAGRFSPYLVQGTTEGEGGFRAMYPHGRERGDIAKAVQSVVGDLRHRLQRLDINRPIAIGLPAEQHQEAASWTV
jgi:hypothetical protein